MSNFVIAGNGIISLTTAFRLLSKISLKDKIFIIGPSSKYGNASQTAGAMLNSFAEVMHGDLERKENLAHLEMSIEATKLWSSFEKEIAESLKLNQKKHSESSYLDSVGYGSGTYVIHNTMSDEFETNNYKSIKCALEKFKQPFEIVDPETIPNYQPHPLHRALEAIYIKNEGWLNPNLLINNLENILANHPAVKFIDDSICRIEGVKSIQSFIGEKGHRYQGDTFVLATGATISKILDNSELNLDIQQVFYGVGVSIEVKTNEFIHQKTIRTPVRGGGCGIYTVPYYKGINQPKNHMLIGASNYVSTEPDYNGRLISLNHLMHSATNQINMNFYDARFIKQNVGLRPISYDGYMLMGETKFKNLYVVSGTKRDGFHMSPVISEEITNQIISNKVNKKFKLFQPERKPIHNLTRSQSVKQIVNNLISEQFQHEFNPSNIKMLNQLKQKYEDDINKIHDNLGANDWGIPVHMINMFKQEKVKFYNYAN